MRRQHRRFSSSASGVDIDREPTFRLAHYPSNGHNRNGPDKDEIPSYDPIPVDERTLEMAFSVQQGVGLAISHATAEITYPTQDELDELAGEVISESTSEPPPGHLPHIPPMVNSRLLN